MPRCHEHNLLEDKKNEGPYGIRLSVISSDPFSALVGSDWTKDKWFASEAQRDAEYIEISRQHQYSRSGDRPTLRYEKIQK